MKDEKREKIDGKKESKSFYLYQFTPLDRKTYLTGFIRTFIKSLIASRGQATLEYFILFTVIIVLTVLGVSAFYQNLQGIGENFFRSCVNLILN